jgi:hypothetical protein
MDKFQTIAPTYELKTLCSKKKLKHGSNQQEHFLATITTQ